MEYNVISADNHIIEAPHTFTAYLPNEYQDRAPRILRGEDGGDGWSFDGQPPRMTFGLNAVAGRAFEDYKASGLTLDEPAMVRRMHRHLIAQGFDPGHVAMLLRRRARGTSPPPGCSMPAPFTRVPR